MFRGGDLKRQMAELSDQLVQLKGKVEALAATPATAAPPPAPTQERPPAANAEVIGVAEYYSRELSSLAAEVLQLGYGYDLDAVQITWNRFAAGDHQAFFAALTGPGGEGLAVHLGNAAEDPDYGADFQRALDRLVENGRRFLAVLDQMDSQRLVTDFYRNGPLGVFLAAVHGSTGAAAQ